MWMVHKPKPPHDGKAKVQATNRSSAASTTGKKRGRRFGGPLGVRSLLRACKVEMNNGAFLEALRIGEIFNQLSMRQYKQKSSIASRILNDVVDLSPAMPWYEVEE